MSKNYTESRRNKRDRNHRALFNEYPSSFQEPYLIIHPGSSKIRYGLSNTAEKPKDISSAVGFPLSFLHNVGQKQPFYISPSLNHQTSFLDISKLESLRKKIISLEHRTAITPSGFIEEVPMKKIQQIGSAHPLKEYSTEFIKFPDISCPITSSDVPIGKEIERLIPDPLKYRIIKPIKYGYISSQHPVNLTALEFLIQKILSDVNAKLNSPLEPKTTENPKNLVKKCVTKVILIITTPLSRPDISIWSDILFKYFTKVIFLPDVSCAALAAELSLSCIVDIGLQRTTIACVHNSTILPRSIKFLDFGGENLSKYLFCILQEYCPGHPLFSNLRNNFDSSILMKIVNILKEQHCNALMLVSSSTQYSDRFPYIVKAPGFLLHTSETEQKPKSIDIPRNITGVSTEVPINVPINQLQHQNISFVQDALYAIPTQIPLEIQHLVPFALFHPDVLPPNNSSFAILSGSENLMYGDKCWSTIAKTENSRSFFNSEMVFPHRKGIQQAIFESINVCESKYREKLFASILCTGASSSFPGLQSRIAEYVQKISGDIKVEVFSNDTEVAPEDSMFVGAKYLADAEKTLFDESILSEITITKAEWELGGMETVIVKSLFDWDQCIPMDPRYSEEFQIIE